MLLITSCNVERTHDDVVLGFDENVRISCTDNVDCINLCSGCYHVDNRPAVDCTVIPLGDCLCVESVCTRVEYAS